MKVNMTPNPLDVVTIHASQGDTEARQWEFELHNNGELIDTSDVTEQMFFKAYEDGTEQLLPENTSTPTTSPFLGDIRYPQGLLTDQEFTYRESPTEEDGLAKITDVKGNTLVWNQLVQNGNFVDASNWQGNGTITVSNNALTYVKPARWNSITNTYRGNIVAGHKYLTVFDAYSESNTMLVFWQDGTGQGGNVYTIPIGTTWAKHSFILTASQSMASGKVPGFDNNASTETTFHLKNYMFIDLTMMGLDSLTLDEVKEWFNTYYPLPYYSYNQGSLLSFNGNGIKTTGTNQFNSEHAISATNVVESNDNGTITIKDVSSLTWSNTYIGYSDVIVGKEYTFKASLKYGRIGGNLSGTSRPVSANQPDTNIGDLIFAAVTSAIPSRTFIPNFTGRIYWWYCTDINNANHQQFTMQPMLSTTDADFEPYTSSTLSLPISTYFPTGMKSAGTVYDELLPTKAITRIGAVDLGTLDYTYQSQNTRFFTLQLADVIKKPASSTLPNIIVPGYTVRDIYSISSQTNMSVGFSSASGAVFFSNADYTDANAFKTAMSGVYLYYELATPTETSFTTASLVTENGEIPLSNEDGTLIGKCTEQLSENPGFFDAKIKLSDEDGDVYSNKIQIHVERKPS